MGLSPTPGQPRGAVPGRANQCPGDPIRACPGSKRPSACCRGRANTGRLSVDPALSEQARGGRSMPTGPCAWSWPHRSTLRGHLRVQPMCLSRPLGRWPRRWSMMHLAAGTRARCSAPTGAAASSRRYLLAGFLRCRPVENACMGRSRRAVPKYRCTATRQGVRWASGPATPSSKVASSRAVLGRRAPPIARAVFGLPNSAGGAGTGVGGTAHADDAAGRTAGAPTAATRARGGAGTSSADQGGRALCRWGHRQGRV